jgi:hypothetical protein
VSVEVRAVAFGSEFSISPTYCPFLFSRKELSR